MTDQENTENIDDFLGLVSKKDIITRTKSKTGDIFSRTKSHNRVVGPLKKDTVKDLYKN